jgi:ribonuclease BN (tRNA processing enzyme)
MGKEMRMNSNDNATLDRRNFMKTAALGAASVSAVAAGLVAPSKQAQAQDKAPAGGPPKEMPGLTSHPHEQEFSVVTVGTGSPIQTNNRARSSTIIQYKGKYFLIDCGDGSSENLFEEGYLYRDIHTMMFTHLHYDHTTDYVDIWLNNWVQGNKHLDLVGPPRTKLLQESMLELYRDDIAYRKFRIPWADNNGLSENVDYHELIGEKKLELHGVKISTTETVHSMYNLAYRFDVDGKSIVVSGDTGYSENLIKLAKGADVLVLDASIILGSRPAAEMDYSKMPKPSSKYEGRFDAENHISLEGTIKTAVATNPKKLVFTHFNSMGNMDKNEVKKLIADTKAKINKSYQGEVIFATDMLEINA